MGGCGFLSRVDLPGPGALSVSFLGSRFLGFFVPEIIAIIFTRS